MTGPDLFCVLAPVWKAPSLSWKSILVGIGKGTHIMQYGLTFFSMIGSGTMMLWLSFDWHGMMDHMKFNLGLYCNEENDWVRLLSQHNNTSLTEENIFAYWLFGAKDKF